jgi:hypothetical protein
MIGSARDIPGLKNCLIFQEKLEKIKAFFFADSIVNGLVYLDLSETFILVIRVWKKMVLIAYCCR